MNIGVRSSVRFSMFMRLSPVDYGRNERKNVVMLSGSVDTRAGPQVVWMKETASQICEACEQSWTRGGPPSWGLT